MQLLKMILHIQWDTTLIADAPTGVEDFYSLPLGWIKDIVIVVIVLLIKKKMKTQIFFIKG